MRRAKERTSLPSTFCLTSSPLRHRRKAALEAAQHFLPKITSDGAERSRAVADEVGFVISPKMTREYRDSRLQLRQLPRSRGYNAAAIAQKRRKLQARMENILWRLLAPCPSRYGKVENSADRQRLIHFAGRRDAGMAFTEEEDAEEAHVRARVDCLEAGPERTARRHLLELKERARPCKNYRDAKR